jgi:hypothetical protein
MKVVAARVGGEEDGGGGGGGGSSSDDDAATLLDLHGRALELASLPATLQLAAPPALLVRLRALHLDHCALAGAFPEGLLPRLPALVELALHANALTRLPEDVCELARLETLRVDDNALEALPARLGECAALRELHLSGNAQLARLPRSLGALHRLHHMLLADCPRLRRLPAAMAGCAALEFILADEATLEWPPQDVWSCGGESVREWLRAHASEDEGDGLDTGED